MEVRGKTIPAGSLVLLMIGAANRDPRQFPRPGRFDISREPNAHIAFGHGIHFCIGAALARREMTVMFDEIRCRLPDLRITGEPEYLQSFFINGIKRLPCAWG